MPSKVPLYSVYAQLSSPIFGDKDLSVTHWNGAYAESQDSLDRAFQKLKSCQAATYRKSMSLLVGAGFPRPLIGSSFAPEEQLLIDICQLLIDICRCAAKVVTKFARI